MPFRGLSVTEPTSTAAAGVAAWKLGIVHKLAAIAGAGALGAILIAFFDAKLSRGQRIAQAAVAGIVAMLFTLPALRWVDHHADWINLTDADPATWLEMALPAAFIIGWMSWGLMGAAFRLRELVRQRGADVVADKIGLTDAER